MSKASLISAIATVAVLLAGAVSWMLYTDYQDFLEHYLDLPEEGYPVLVEQGDSLTAVLRKFEASGIITIDWRWKILMRQQPVTVHVGEYRLTPAKTPLQVLKVFDEGLVLQHRFTIVEGWSWRQLLKALQSDPILVRTIEGFIDASEIESIADSIGAGDIDHAEGWFLPETYYFVRGESDVDILARAHKAMKRALKEVWLSRDPDVPLESPYDLLTLASIVEKETSLPEERTHIAGVFVRRLNRNMRLQTDPTVIYGLGPDFDGNIRRRDLRTDNPYNTYTRHGLPPTPIAMPGKQTLIATANPSDGTTLFFVADGQGGHTFSTTLAEHEEAVKKLVERQ